MKRRREISPKMVRNKRALVKYVLLAVLVGVCGSGLTYLAGRSGGGEQSVDGDSAVGTWAGILKTISGGLLLATVVGTVGLVFFGVRAYLMGTKGRFSLQSNRMKIKKS